MQRDEFVFRGDLGSTSLPEMLATIHRHGVPGVMEAERAEATKRVFFIDGDVIFATSSDLAESLGEYLLRQGRITESQYRASSDQMRRSPGTRHGTVLVQMGFLRPDELGAAVREQVQQILWNLFNWESGRVTFRVGRFRDDEVYKIKIPTPRAILSGCKHISDGRLIIGRLGGRKMVYSRCERPQHLESLRLESAEQELLDLVDGRRTLYELCEAGPMGAGLNARVLYAFAELRLIQREAGHSAGIRIQVRGTDPS